MVKPHEENPLSEQEHGVLCTILATNPLFVSLVSRWLKKFEDSSLKNRVHSAADAIGWSTLCCKSYAVAPCACQVCVSAVHATTRDLHVLPGVVSALL